MLLISRPLLPDSIFGRDRLVASLVHESHFAGLVQLLRDVRHYLYFPELDNAAIFTKRRELGTAIASVIEEATYQVLDKLAASRIVVFSDIPLDYLPYHGSMLGLEVPISRYPILLAYFIVNEGFRSAARSMVNAEGTLCSVLCANEAHDPATAWACETGKRVGNMFSSYFGRNVLCGPPLAKSARCHHISIRGQDRGNLRFRPYTPLGFLPALVSSLSGKSGICVSRSLGFEERAL